MDSKGMTFVEILTTLVVMGVLSGGGAAVLAKYGSKNKVKYESEKVVNDLWELRSDATTGVKNPCMDFPAVDSVRTFSDSSTTPNGYGAGDLLLKTYKFGGKVKILSIAGGQGLNHYVCFESRGVMGSAGAALLVTIGADSSNCKTVRILPSTGMAKVL
jgi:prepilin-type N-terminal cleavage/methylation domain-containing protein